MELELILGRVLSKKEQQEVARRIQAGEKAKAVVGEVLTGGGDTDAAFRHLIGALSRDLPRLQGQVGEIPAKRLARCRNLLKGAVTLLHEILERGA